ncbi:MAG: hypothetical protein M1828_001988 [Chrysothrix sp. TS-e1954]|nr:MAG: hypothetical protein M1828_001988 [Chrysothrix sp. TS-e1954]
MREIGAFHYDNVKVYISAICLLYAAPPVYELANYIILGRVLYYLPQHSPIHPGRVYTTFGFMSAVVEALTANGASYSSNTSLPRSKQNEGRSLIKASLVLQLILIVCLVCLAGWFHLRCRRAKLLPKNIRIMLYTLYTSSSLILIRTIYRTVEYWTAAEIHLDGTVDPETLSPIIRYEWFFWVFEGVVMLLNGMLQNWQHPGRYLPVSTKVFLTEDGERETAGPGYGGHRSFFKSLVDPFDLVGLVKGTKQGDRYWEQAVEPVRSEQS